MNKYFFIFITAFIFLSCGTNTEKDCKKLIVKSWQAEKVELDPERKMNGIDFPPDFIEKMNNAKLIYAFTPEGLMLDNNSTEIGEYKITLDCNKLLLQSKNRNKIDTFQIKHLTNDKFVMLGQGLVTTFKPLN